MNTGPPSVCTPMVPAEGRAAAGGAVALTRAAWEKCVRVPPGVLCQDEAGRLWDLVWLLRCAAARAAGTLVRFGVHVRNDKRERVPPLVRFKALCAPGDDGEPVVSVMLGNEN